MVSRAEGARETCKRPAPFSTIASLPITQPLDSFAALKMGNGHARGGTAPEIHVARTLFQGRCVPVPSIPGTLFQTLIADNSLVLDIGAHSGQFSKIFARCANQGVVLAVEPAAYPLSILRTVKRVHRWRRVEIIEAGVSDTEGSLVLRTPVKRNGVVRFGLASVARNPGPSCREQVIPVTTVDALTTRFGRDRRCAFIKADIEGHEYPMLVGAKRTIDRDRPALFLEVSAEPQAIEAFLRSHGYVIFGVPEGDALTLDEWQPIRNGNILAIHASRTDDLERVRRAPACSVWPSLHTLAGTG